MDLRTLERIEASLFRSRVRYEDAFGLYGGQVAAQALRAAAETVGPGRHPHSLHGYFLSRGDPSRPASGGRGMYTGRIFSRDGRLAAGIAPESLFRPGTRRPGPLAD